MTKDPAVGCMQNFNNKFIFDFNIRQIKLKKKKKKLILSFQQKNWLFSNALLKLNDSIIIHLMNFLMRY